MKLSKKTFPKNHTSSTFKCFGPPATKDGEFSTCMIADLGCFDQSGQNKNAFYHGAVAQSTLDNKWYVYFCWGRTNTSKQDFQFVECNSQQHAQTELAKQLHKKNDKRGEWFNHPTLGKILRAKTNKDCYLVRQQAVRSYGLDDAKNISLEQPTFTISKNLEKEVESLLRDLKLGTASYTRTSLSSSNIPSLESINQARNLISLAVNSKSQKDVEEYSQIIYGKIPKRKGKNDSWLITGDNAKSWLDDLDAFESALKSSSQSGDILDLDFDIKYLPVNSELYKFVLRWTRQATQNKHAYLKGEIKIKHIWEINKSNQAFLSYLFKIKPGVYDKPLHQLNREDISTDQYKVFEDTNTRLLFHGTRSINIGGILSSGIRLPKELKGVTINGSMFGHGAYFSDDYKKSAGYCSIPNGYWSKGDGQINNRQAFMFINDVVLGKPFIPKDRCSNHPEGYNSVFAKQNYSGVQNNEFITYTTDSINLRYLIEFSI